VTTTQDHGSAGHAVVPRLRCEVQDSNLYPTLLLALRDMREANGRDLVTGEGDGNASWIGLSLAMIVLDTLSGSSRRVGERWKRMLVEHRISEDDADIIYAFRCSLLHGYGPPKPGAIGERKLLLTDDRAAFALDTSRSDLVWLSVPVFCGHLVERIAAEKPDGWDTSMISTDYQVPEAEDPTS
jgi:hypothetical protein